MGTEGKILILKLHKKRLSLLMSDNRILAARAQQDAAAAVGDIYIGKVQSISPNIITICTLPPYRRRSPPPRPA